MLWYSGKNIRDLFDCLKNDIKAQEMELTSQARKAV